MDGPTGVTVSILTSLAVVPNAFRAISLMVPESAVVTGPKLMLAVIRALICEDATDDAASVRVGSCSSHVTAANGEKMPPSEESEVLTAAESVTEPPSATDTLAGCDTNTGGV